MENDKKPLPPGHGFANDMARSRQQRDAMRPMFEELYHQWMTEHTPGVEYSLEWHDNGWPLI